MKRSIIITLLLLGVGGTALVFSFNQGIKENIIEYFETGDAAKLSALLSEDAVLTLFDAKEFERKDVISIELNTFFEKYPPKTFKIRHYGKSIRENCFYMIGIFQATEEVFRVSIMIDNGKIEDINISFEKPISDYLSQ